MAVNTMASSIGKNKEKTGTRRVPSPNPEKRVNPEPSNETKQMMTYSMGMKIANFRNLPVEISADEKGAANHIFAAPF